MKSKLLALALFAVTTGAVILLPLRQSTGASQQTAVDKPSMSTEAAMIEVVFALDTTGSMSGLIETAKEKIWSIASSLAQAENAPEIRLGLVAYRDRGDSYVTQVTGLSSDLDSVYATLMDYRAAGGGDTPESVNKALHDAVHAISWSQDPNTYQVVFLVGDAPPHHDYQDEIQYPQIIADARQRGILINTIQAGSASATRQAWQKIASLGAGAYFQVDPSGNAVAISTPFDEKLAALSKDLDGTRLYYGDPETRSEKEAKQAATRKLHAAASVESRARRATFNTSKSGEANLLGDNELVDDVSSGRVDIGAIARDELPAALQTLTPQAAKDKIEAVAEQRHRLKAQISELARQRSDYLNKKVEQAGGAESSFDARLYGAVREQAAGKGFEYDAAAPAY